VHGCSYRHFLVVAVKQKTCSIGSTPISPLDMSLESTGMPNTTVGREIAVFDSQTQGFSRRVQSILQLCGWLEKGVPNLTKGCGIVQHVCFTGRL
jgi:hypothetical protein